jgi:hypothetical protein
MFVPPKTPTTLGGAVLVVILVFLLQSPCPLDPIFENSKLWRISSFDFRLNLDKQVFYEFCNMIPASFLFFQACFHCQTDFGLVS